jgi:hypothetical protein
MMKLLLLPACNDRRFLLISSFFVDIGDDVSLLETFWKDDDATDDDDDDDDDCFWPTIHNDAVVSAKILLIDDTMVNNEKYKYYDMLFHNCSADEI